MCLRFRISRRSCFSSDANYTFLRGQAKNPNIEGSRKPEHHDEEEHANRGAIGQMIAAGLGPVCLSLLTWWCLEANGQLRRPAHAQGGKETADNAFGARPFRVDKETVLFRLAPFTDNFLTT